jgi:hypothetical protein
VSWVTDASASQAYGGGMSPDRTQSPTRARPRARVIVIVLGLLLVGAQLIPSTIAGASSPATRFVAGPTPTPIPGMVKHGG